MNLFDIIGPVMVGPSSSHTAGVVRIGNFVHRIFGVPDSVTIRFHGSFARTWRGHGSDKAIIAGILGFPPDDERIRESLDLGRRSGLEFRFETVELPDAHPNTIVVEAKAAGRSTVVYGESVGGGNIIIRRIDDIELEFDGHYDTLIVSHTDHPGVIAFVAGVIARAEINIAHMTVYRSKRGGTAIMVIEADGVLDHGLKELLEEFEYIDRATVIAKLI